jgi:outer membrane lipoprotein-sorting protein
MRSFRRSPTEARPAGPARRAWPALAALAAALLLATGCAGGSSRPDPLALSGAGPALDLARSLKDLDDRAPSFAVRGGLTLVDGGTTRFFRFELLAVRPAKLALTILDPLGRPAMRALSDGQSLTVLDILDQVAAVGAAGSGSLGRVLPVGLGQEALLAILSQSLLLRPDQASAGQDSSGQITSLLISTLDASGEATWSVALAPSQAGGLPRVAGQSVKGQALLPDLSVSYGTFKPVAVESLGQSREFPHLVEASLGDGRRLTVRYDEVRLGLDLPDSYFQAQIPEGFSIRPI